MPARLKNMRCSGRARADRVTQAVVAAALDSLFGDPRDRYHPVRWVGKLIEFLEPRIYGWNGGFAGGLLLAAGVLAVSCAAASALMRAAGRRGRACRIAMGSALIYFTVSRRSLEEKAAHIESLLARGMLEDARLAVADIVGRDTTGLDSREVARATVESVAENASDGVFAPLLFAAAGGPVAAVFYRVANTLDSMVGYRSERYEMFGRTSARLDDALNYVPARLTAAAFVAAGAVRGADTRAALEAVRRDAPKHASPNAGYPEAAMAGLLKVRLGGVNRYEGRAVDCPYMGEPIEPLVPEKIGEAAGYLDLACGAFLLALSLAGLLLRGVRR